MSGQIAREERVFLAALAGGAQPSVAARIAAGQAGRVRGGAAWSAVAEAPAPLEALRGVALVNPCVLPFLEDGPRPLRERAEAALEAMRGASTVRGGRRGALEVAVAAVVGLGTTAIVTAFVLPVFAQAGLRADVTLGALAFLAALVLAVAAFVARLAVRGEVMGMQPGPLGRAYAELTSAPAVARPDLVLAFRWLGAADVAQVGPRAVLAGLSRALPTRRLRALALAAPEGGDAAAVVMAWSANALLPPALGRAARGLIEAGAVARPLTVLAALAERLPSRASRVERALLSAAVLVLGAGAYLVLSAIYGCITQLPGVVG